MKILTAILFSATAAIAGFIGELWHVHRDPTYSPELGFVVAAVGLTFLSLVGGAMFYGYGAVSRAIRKEAKIVTYWMPAVFGIAYWPELMGVHQFLSEEAHVPDLFWLLESAVICGASFEIIRAFYKPLKNQAQPDGQRTTRGI